ncbi:lysozyme inhibitor LprI family protein [Taklimakanibacter lacteus]|uniref:lysozyme inhibitor LprI family protein n=1 Tax=Taklimakanibacter lacteus TaxID=2268456 RepID=UPI0013C3EFB7
MQSFGKSAIAGFTLMAGALPAVAFDCGKAQSVVEKAICADPKLKAADDAMGTFYAALRNVLDGDGRKDLVASQRKWVKSREDNCGYQQGTELTSCILTATEERYRLLSAAPESGPGASSTMVASFIQQDGDQHHYDVDYTLARFAKASSPGERLFNAEVRKIEKSAPLKRLKEAVGDEVPYAAFAAMTITYASPKLLSAKIDAWVNAGGAHGNGGTSSINIDLGKGVALKASDLFDTKGQAALKADCVTQIFAQKKDRNDDLDFKPEDDPNYSEATIVDHLKSLDSWSFWADKAVVTFDAYSIGSYAEGPYECEFAMTKLKSLAKPGAVLPE